MQRLVLALFLLGGGAGEGDLLKDAGALRDKGQYQAALEKYEKVLTAPSGDRAYTVALHHAIDCETRLGRYEHALDRVRAAKLPGDRVLRDAVVLLRLEMLRNAAYWYGNPDEIEEGAQGGAKLSRAQARKELEAQIGALMADHAALAQTPLSAWGEFAEVKDVDPARYATVWDLVVLRLADALGSLPREKIAPPDPLRFTDADFPRQMPVDAHPLLRMGALYEDSGERFRIFRVQIPRVHGLTHSEAERKLYLEKASARLRSFMDGMKTPVARNEAGADAADLLRDLDRPVEALALCERVLKNAPEADDAAAHCRRLRYAITEHELQLQTHAVRMPGKGAVHLRAHNLGTLWLRLYRVDPLKDTSGKELWSNSLHDLSPDKVQRFMRWSWPVAQWSADLKDPGDHRWLDRDLDVPAPGNGAYLVVASEDKSFSLGQKVVAAAMVDVTDLTIARAETRDGVVFYAFDAATGGVAAQSAVHVGYTTDWGKTHREELHTGADGVALWHAPDKQAWYDAIGKRGDSWAWFSGTGYHYQDPAQPPVFLFLATDRPIYRPGQSVQVRVTAVERGGDQGPRIAAKRKITLELHDANGRQVAQASVTSGEFGSAHATFAIAGGALLGQYQLIAKLPDDNRVASSSAVAVEEYKRPEFEITLEALKGAAKYGQKATLPGKVTYYFGGPAPDVKVNFVVTRKRWIPWWAWQRGESAATEIARGTAKTNAQGKYEVTFVPEKDPSVVAQDDPDLPRVDDFEVHVDAHDAGGRTLEASRTLRLGEKSLLVALESEHGFWMSDESAHLSARLVNLDEVAVAGQGSWELWRLGSPKETPQPSVTPLQRVLRDYPTEARIGSGAVAFNPDKPADIALPRLPSGGYRLVVTTKDPFGQTVRGAYALLVADAKSGALALPLPPVALLHDTEVEPGGTVRFLAGGTAASGTYHVEAWRGRERHMHRVDKGASVRVVDVAVGAGERGGFTVRWLGASGLQIVGGEANVRVPRRDKDLVVKFDPRPAAVEPGAKVRWGVRAVDGRGKPVEMEALVAVYDRSLELYARQSPPWADALYAPPPEPPSRTDAQIEVWGSTEPLDRAVQEAIEKAIRKSWKPHPLPRFAWESSEDRDADGIPDSADEAEVVTINGLEGHLGKEVSTRGGYMYRNKARLTLLSESVMAGEKAEEPAFGAKPEKKNAPPPPPPPPRINMAETALFLPYLHTGADGRGSFEFTAPERLTSWRVKLSGLGRAVQAGTASDQFVTRKQLMVRVEIPRFLREGDRSQVIAVVHNETDKPLDGRVQLGGAEGLGARDVSRSVKIPAHGLASVDFAIAAPEGLANYKLRASVTAGSLGDAEERELPVLPSRERLIASRLAALRGEDAKELLFEELAHSGDPSLRSESLVVSVEPQLALSILRSIPSLIEYPYECVEQTIDRYVPLAIISEIYKKHPDIARASAAAPHRKTQHEPWLADDARRMTSLVETPWLAQSQGGSDDDRLIDLLDPALVTRLRSSTEDKLARMQNGDGSFAWFPGGRGDFYMTLFVLDGMANLTEFGIEPPNSITRRAIGYVVRELPRHITKEESDLALLAYGAHVLTSFDPQKFPEAQPVRKEAASWMKFVLANRQVLTPLGRAYAARTLDRLGDHTRAMELLESALDGSRTDPLIGTYWTPERYSWRWYSDSVEKHAYFMRTLNALKPSDPRIAGMAQWLLWNRKGNAWHSTKASAAAVYALLDLMQKQGALDKPERFHVKWGARDENVVVKPDDPRREPLFWKAAGGEVTPALAKVRIEKTGPGIAFASATWLYSSTKLQAAHKSDATEIERRYFLRVHKSDGDHLEPLASGAHVHVGDDIEVRLVVKTRSQFEYVQIKEPHGAGFEESALRSGWRWEKLSYYLEPRDSLLNFFVSWMPHGEFELRHALRPTTPGRYRIGSAVLQSMYSPDITAYSSGMELEVER